MNEFLDKIKNATLKQVLIVLITVGPTLAAGAKGIWSIGVENYWWGNGHGKIERTQLCLMREYYGKSPLEEHVIELNSEKIFVKVYETGDALIARTNSGALSWSLARTQDEVIAKCDQDSKKVALNLSGVAYASEPVQVGVYQDTVIEWLDSVHVKVKRTFDSGCYQIIVINAAIGQVVEILESSC